MQNPRRLPAQISAGRVSVGIANAVRPGVGVLPSGEILLVMQHTYDEQEAGKIRDEIYLAGWETRQGDILSLIGSGSQASAVASDGSSSPAEQPSASRIALFRSTDRGQTWTPAAEPDMSFPGQHPSLIRLRNGRCLLTFTLPGSSASAGLQAVLIQETDIGFTAELQTDRLLAERRTLPDQPGGGGFGNTIQLPDGRMISAGTWRDGRGTPFVEAVSWDLPASR